MIVPNGGIKAGYSFGLGPSVPFSNSWESISGSFILSTNGDNMHLFCMSNTPLFLSSLIYNGIGWSEPNNDPSSFTSDTSALPSPPSVALPNKRSFSYNGKKSGSKDEILVDFSNPSKWVESDGTEVISLSNQNFSISTQASGARRYVYSVYLIFVSTWMLFMCIH